MKYPSTTILKNVNILAKVNKSPSGRFHNSIARDTYIITINVRTVTLVDIIYEQNEENYAI